MQNYVKSEYKYSAITGKIINCAMQVHSVLGNGFQENVYQRALAKEMELQGVNFAREVTIPIFYKNTQVGTRRVDFMVENVISVEIKAVTQLDKVHFAQAMNYLEAFQIEIGLLINFGANELQKSRLENKKFKRF